MRTHLDLFSGIGGFALACRWAGVETIGFAEIDDYACRVLAKNFPGVPNYGDVRNVPGSVSAWLITGGFPCQPFSTAGKRRGASDDRWLWPEMARVIERVRPRWVLGENVPGIIKMELDTVLSDLERLGYTAWPIVIPAVGVDAPHRRDRVWIVGYTERSGQSRHDRRGAGKESANGRKDVADTDAIGRQRRAWQQRQGWRAESTHGSVNATNANGTGLAQRESIAGDDGTQQPPVVGGCRWQPEPELGRVAHGIPNKLDGDRLDEQSNSEKGSATSYSGGEMPGVWFDGQPTTSSSGHHETIRSSCAVPEMPYSNTQKAGDMGNWQQANGCVCDMRKSVYASGLTSAQDMQRGMPECARSIECQQAMAKWKAEPNIPRVAHGISNRVDRLRGLGNAIVPQVAYLLISMMIAADEVAEVAA